MKFSIIIPAYNTVETIEKCLVSIADAGQNKEIEIIVIDDGSTDTTAAVVAVAQEKYPCIHYFRQSNSGVSAARNSGLNKASGEYVLFVDSDDCLDVRYFDDFQDTDLIVTPYTDVHPDKSVSNTYAYRGLFTDRDQIGKAIGKINLAYVWGKFFRRSIIEDNQLRFDTALQYGEDNVFVLQYCSHIVSCYIRNESPYLFTHHDGESLSKKYVSNLDQFFSSADEAREKLYVVFPSYKEIYETWCPDKELAYLRIKLRNAFRRCSPYISWKSKYGFVQELFQTQYKKPKSVNYMAHSKLELLLNILLIIRSPLMTTLVLDKVLR